MHKSDEEQSKSRLPQRAVSPADYTPHSKSPLPGATHAEVVSVRINGESWRAVTSLAHSTPEDAVFQLDPESGEVRFGDGVHGQRPPQGSSTEVTYRYGAGKSGMELTLRYPYAVAPAYQLNLRVDGAAIRVVPERRGILACLRRCLFHTK